MTNFPIKILEGRAHPALATSREHSRGGKKKKKKDEKRVLLVKVTRLSWARFAERESSARRRCVLPEQRERKALDIVFEYLTECFTRCTLQSSALCFQRRLMGKERGDNSKNSPKLETLSLSIDVPHPVR